jgi:hypothetical protein
MDVDCYNIKGGGINVFRSDVVCKNSEVGSSRIDFYMRVGKWLVSLCAALSAA